LPFYQVSKASLSMLTVEYAEADTAFRIDASNPGGTDTDILDHIGTQTVAEGSEAIVTVATVSASGSIGTLLSRTGTVP